MVRTLEWMWLVGKKHENCILLRPSDWIFPGAAGSEETRSIELQIEWRSLLLQAAERRWDGESNGCRRVLLDAGRAEAHKAGYYVCKSRRVPEPQGKQAAFRAQSRSPAPGRVTTRRLENTTLISVEGRSGAELTANLNG